MGSGTRNNAAPNSSDAAPPPRHAAIRRSPVRRLQQEVAGVEHTETRRALLRREHAGRQGCDHPRWRADCKAEHDAGQERRRARNEHRQRHRRQGAEHQDRDGRPADTLRRETTERDRHHADPQSKAGQSACLGGRHCVGRRKERGNKAEIGDQPRIERTPHHASGDHGCEHAQRRQAERPRRLPNSVRSGG